MGLIDGFMWLAVVGLAMLMLDLGRASWRSSERLAGEPAPDPGQIIRASEVPRLPVRRHDGSGTAYKTADAAPEPEPAPATEMDEVDMLAAFDARIKAIEREYAMDAALEAFRQGSMAMAAYRSLVLDRTGEFTEEQRAELDSMLAAV